MVKLLLFLQFVTVILSPLYILRFRIGEIPSTFLEVLILLTLFVFFINIFKLRVNLKELKSNFDLPIIIFFIASLIAIFKSNNILGALGIFKAYILEPILFYYSLVFTTKKLGLKWIILALFVSGIWLSLLAFLQKITKNFTLAPTELLQGRVTAVFNSANSLALYLGPLTVFALSRSFEVNRKIARLFYITLLVIFTLVIIWTKSRGGVVGEMFAILIFFYLLWAMKNKIIRKIWWMVPVFIISLATFLIISVYKTPLTIKPDTMQIRLSIWAGTINLLKDSPLFGAGLNGFRSLYSDYYRVTNYQEEVQYPHNIILTFWVEMGLMGLLGITWILIRFYRNLWLVTIKKKVYFGAGLMAAMSYLLIHGIVDVPYFKNDLSLQFWVLISFAEYLINEGSLKS